MSELDNTISGGVYFAWKNPPPTITRVRRAPRRHSISVATHGGSSTSQFVRRPDRTPLPTTSASDDHDINGTAQQWSGHNHLPGTDTPIHLPFVIRNPPIRRPLFAIRQYSIRRPQLLSQSKPIRHQSPRKQGHSSKTVDGGAHKQAQGGSQRRISRHRAG